MPGLGHNAFLGVGAETTWGTGVTPTHYQGFVSETIQEQFSEKVIQGITANRVQTRRVRGNKTVAGDIQFEVDAEGSSDSSVTVGGAIGVFLKSLLPKETVTTFTGAGAKHEFESPVSTSDALPPGLTVRVGRSATESGSYIAGTVFDYVGGRVSQLKLDAALDDMVKAGVTLTFQDRVAGSTSPSPAFTTENPLMYHTGSFTVAGGAVDITAFSLTIAAGMKAERRRIGSNLIIQQLPGIYDVTGSITAYFDEAAVASGGLVDRFMAGTASAIVLDLEGSVIPSSSPAEKRRLKIEIPTAFFNGETPKVSGGGTEFMLTLPFRAIKTGGGSPDKLIRVTLSNQRTTAY